MKITKSTNAKIKFKKISNVCKFEIKSFKNKQINSVCESHNIKSFYQLVNNKLGKHRPPVLIKIDNETADAKSAAQEPGKYFYSTYVNDEENLPSFDYNFKKRD